MNKNQKFMLVFIGFCMLVVIGLVAFNVFMPKPEIKADDIQVSERSVVEEVAEQPEVKAKEYVNIYFIGKNEHNEEVYKAVKRVYNKDVDGSKLKFAVTSLILGPKLEEKQRGVYTEVPSNEEVYKAVKRVYNKDVDGSKLKFAVTSLILGPKLEEKQRGVYTEVPSGAEIINITEQQNKVIVNLNSAFVNGGGTDSLYKRLYQLIKTVNLNSKVPVYLYIDGQQADVVGGEGIMLSQPLSNSSLDN